MKKCYKCGEIKSKEENFSKDKRSKDGYQQLCKLCRRQHYLDNKSKYKKKHSQYYQDNKDNIIKRTSLYKINNKDKRKQYNIDNINLIKKQRSRQRLKPANFNTYANRLLEVVENPRLSDDGVSLEVKCRYCGKYFKPTKLAVVHRINALNSNKGEKSLYCSDQCKNACPVYRKKLYQEGQGKSYTTEVVPLLRQLVLKRDNYTCQECKATNVELHCHHLIPKSYDKIIQNDPTNCITLCKNCHIKKHQKAGCKYDELRKNSINSCL
jgi:hypothetical protein